MKVLCQNNFILVLVACMIMTSCNSCGNKTINVGFEKEFTENGCLIDSPKIDLKTKYGVNFFIETSGSMFGFMPSKSKTTFQNSLWDVVSYVNTMQNGGIKLFQLKSQKESPIPISITTFRDDLNSGSFQSNSQTDIPEMLDSVLVKTKENQVSVIVSDLIFSPTSTAPALMEQITTDIRNRFAGKLLASDIIQVYSEFYFKSKPGYEAKSPYYIWIIGNKVQVNDLSKKIKTRIKNYNEVAHGLSKPNISYSILPYAENNPTVTAMPCSENYSYYSYCTWDGSEQAINIPLAINLNDLNPNYKQINYLMQNVISESNSAKISLENITTQINTSNSTDKTVLDKISATHLLKIKVSNIQNESNIIKINIKSQSPKWIDSVNQDTEDNLRKKTMGFKRMISGLDQAFPTEQTLINKPLLILLTKRTY